METVLNLLLAVLTWTWWIIVPLLLFLGVQAYRRRTWVSSQRYVLLQVSVPKENDKAPVAAEQMFAALHGIRRDARALFFEGATQDHIGFEIAATGGRINFYAYVPEGQKSFAEGQIYAQYPKAEIKVVPDYVTEQAYGGKVAAGTELKLTAKDVYPIKTFLNFEDVDPLSGITAVMGDLNDDESVWIQILGRPASDSWRRRSEAELKRLQGGGSSLGAGSIFGAFGRFIGELFQAAAASPTDPKKPTQTAQPVQVDEALSSGLKEKGAKLGYEAKIRVVALAGDTPAARSRLNAAVGAFKQYNTTNLNGFTAGKISVKTPEVLAGYRGRSFVGKGPILNIEEMASIFHLPNTSVETPTIAWTTSSKGEPPENLPIVEEHKDLTVFAETNFRNRTHRFGIKPDDRRRHVYVIGKTGMGKTHMLQTMVLSDMAANRGLAVVDPHGDFIETVLDHIPSERADDVIVFNPADRAHPIAFNIMEKVDRDAKPLVASGIVGVFEKIYGHSWGPRLEHILRNTILALLDYPDSTLLDVPRLLADQKFRDKVIPHIEDIVVREFWTNEFANYTDRQRVEAIAPIQNKVGQFLSSTLIRNIVGQKHTAINLRQVMDEGKILLIKLSKGELGEDASALLGAMLITKIQLAAMSRADVAEETRRDFYLYVDEFQNFATESFATILSEARKYRLNLAIAHQYVAQMPEEVRDAVFGNIGTMISFRVGATDAAWLVKEFEPVFLETDIVNLDKYHVYLKLAVDGVTNEAFSAKTIPLPSEQTSYRDQVIQQTREWYASPRDEVEASFVATDAVGIAAGAGSADDDKKRRFQSYLDKERTFAERGSAEQSAPSVTRPTPATDKSPIHSRQQSSPQTKPAPKPAPDEKSSEAGSSRSTHQPARPAATPTSVAPSPTPAKSVESPQAEEPAVRNDRQADRLPRAAHKTTPKPPQTGAAGNQARDDNNTKQSTSNPPPAPVMSTKEQAPKAQPIEAPEPAPVEPLSGRVEKTTPESGTVTPDQLEEEVVIKF